MKKISLLTLTCCLALLTACQTKTNKHETANSTSSTRVSSSSKVSSTKATKASSSTTTSISSAPSTTSSSSQTEASSQTTSETSSAMDPQTSQTENQPPSNEELYATTLHLVATDPTPGRGTHYAFVDIDGNGTAELITAQIGEGYLHLAAIYYLQNGVPTYLARSYVAGGGGRRESFTIYHDGTVEWDEWSSGNGQGTAYLYQLAPDNSGHWVIGQTDFNQRELADPEHVNQFDGGRMALDPASFNWTAF